MKEMNVFDRHFEKLDRAFWDILKLFEDDNIFEYFCEVYGARAEDEGRECIFEEYMNWLNKQ